MAVARWTIDDVNGWDRQAFVANLGFLFEGSPWIAAETWAKRPFADRADLHRKLCETLDQATAERKRALIRAHPDLVGRAALTGTLTRESTGEQRAAGLDPDALSSDEIATFSRLNESYKETFRFPFVICARENKKESILAGFRARLTNSRETEIATALGEIAKICHYRLADVVSG
ncbi:MAG: 2-oxo-4-hydroxy-4-carboxy-5-ureidoimidazoline decarboxylase [Thermomicrobiales bacterium]